MARKSSAYPIFHPSSGNRESRPGWAGSSTAWTCICIRSWPPASWPNLLVDNQHDPAVGYYGSVIQAAFLAGWALGGGLFGRIGDRVGGRRALMLTILTYAMFTGLSFLAQTWWHLLICRFLAALGIGGEWAVGAALLSETWPRCWGPWIAAVLQSAVNCGVLLAMAAVPPLTVPCLSPYYQYRCVFLVGVLPALLVLWIRRNVPEPEEWHAAEVRARARRTADSRPVSPPDVRRTTVLTTVGLCVVAVGPLGLHVLVMQHLRNLPELSAWSDAQKTRFQTTAMVLVMVTSIAGNFLAGAVARRSATAAPSP